MKTTLLPLALLLVSFQVLADDQALFFRTPTAEVAYQAYVKLRFGRVFFTPTAVTFSTSDFAHHPQGYAKIEAFRIQWLAGQTIIPVSFQGPVRKTENYIRQEASGPVTQRHQGYDAVQFPLGNTGITQEWLTREKHLSFDLKGTGKADWSKARFRLEGIEAHLTPDGIRAKGKLGEVLITSPITRIKKNGIWREVPSAFVQAANQTFAFSLPDECKTADSIWIDPRLIFSGYSGSVADNWGCSATYDQRGNSFLASIAFGLGFPTTLGCYQNHYASIGNDFSVDVSLQKFSPDGRILKASTYLGGQSQEVPHSIVCTANGDLVVFGTTSSFNFPVTRGSNSTIFNGGSAVDPFSEYYNIQYDNGSDFFIARLDSNLSRLEAGTFLGGSGNDGINTCNQGDNLANYGDQFRGSVEVDRFGNVYIGGTTHSRDFPIVNGFNGSASGNSDGVVCMLNPALQLTYSTLIGGNGSDVINSITLDAQNRIGFCGMTSSSNLPTTSSAYQRNPQTAVASGMMHDRDAFAGIINPVTRGAPDFLSYSSSPSYDQAFFADFDSQNRLYIMGQTTGSMPNTSPSSISNSNGGLFIQRFTANGGGLDLALRLGSPSYVLNISPTAFQVDFCGQIYFSGWGGDLGNHSPESCAYQFTTTAGLPVSSDGIRQQTDGSDFYVCVLLPDGQGLKYASFMGANSTSIEHVDGGTSRFDPRGFIYQAVCAGCGNTSDFPSTQGVYSRYNRSDNCNSAIFKIDLTPLYLPILAQVTPVTICPGQEFTLTHNARPAVGAYISYGNGEVTSLTPSPVNFTYDSAGTYTIVVRGEGPGCPNIDVDSVTVIVKAGVEKLRDTIQYYCLGDTISLHGPHTSHVLRWHPSTYLSNDTSPDPISVPRTNINYQLSIRNAESGCADSSIVALRARVIPINPTDSVVLDSCLGLANLSIRLTGRADTTRWLLGGIYYYQNNIDLVYTQPTLDTAYLFRTTRGCKGVATLPLNIYPKKINLPKTVSKDSALASCNSLVYTYALQDAGNNYARWLIGGQLLSSEPAFTPEESLATGPIQLRIYGSGCVDSVIVQHSPLHPKVPNVVTKNGDGLNDSFQPLNLPSSATLTIFDRWGRRLGPRQPAQDGYAFDNHPPGTYFFLIEDPSAGRCRGWVELVK